MITHFAQLHLQTVSVQGIKQFYHDRLGFPVIYESNNEVGFQPTEHFTISFKEVMEPLAPVHIAFEVPLSEFEHAVEQLQKAGITLLAWPDGRIIDDFETGRNVYFRDGDGNLLEIITHTYVKEGVLPPSGELKILYLREIGFPVDHVAEFRELLVDILNFKLDKVSDNFSFAIGGTAHAVIPSKQRKWIPIAMTALPPKMDVVFGVSSSGFVEQVKAKLTAKGIPYEEKENGQLHFRINEYRFYLEITHFPEEAPSLLHLPFSRLQA